MENTEIHIMCALRNITVLIMVNNLDIKIIRIYIFCIIYSAIRTLVAQNIKSFYLIADFGTTF